MTSKGKLLSVLALGAAAGTILGVLLAPDKGSKTLNKLRKKAQGLIDRFSKKAEEGKSTFSDFKKKAMAMEHPAKQRVKKTHTTSHSAN